MSGTSPFVRALLLKGYVDDLTQEHSHVIAQNNGVDTTRNRLIIYAHALKEQTRCIEEGEAVRFRVEL